jgi:hypothetical protein
VIARLVRPFLYMAACLALGAMVIVLLSMAGVSTGIAKVVGNIGFVAALGVCIWRDRDFQPVPVFAAALITTASCLALMFAALLALPRSMPLALAFSNVFELGYVPIEGGIHGPPIDLFVTLWLLSMLGLIGAGLLLGGALRLYWPRPKPAGQA